MEGRQLVFHRPDLYGTALNITMWSYCGQANICMLTDREVLKDGWQLFNYFVDELNALVALVKQ